MPFLNSFRSLDNNETIDEDATKHFKKILLGIFLILILFLAYFIYNLIKCYLPKWNKSRNELREERNSIEIPNKANNIEFEE